MRNLWITLFILGLGFSLYSQPAATTIDTKANHNDWGWEAIVMDNGLITAATVPAIGARIMQYDLGTHSSIFVNPDLAGETRTPNQGSWHNYGGYKVWPAPQEKWGWPPPAQIDAAAWEAEIVAETDDSVAVFVSSPLETWSKTPNLRMERRAVMYKGSSRLKLEQSIINENSNTVSWSIWDVTQAIVHHEGENDYENFWVYFPIKTEGSVFGSDGVKTSANSSAWKGEVAPGVYGVQFKPEGKKIFADSPEGWIVYVDEREGTAYAKVFDLFEGAYPDDGACNEVWINSNPRYLEVEVLSPIWNIAPGGKIDFTIDWYAAKANGPILSANHAGLVEESLVLHDNGTLTGTYGIFHVGKAQLVFMDADGAELATGAAHTVSPNEKFQLSEMIAAPEGTQTVALRITDSQGNIVGYVEKKTIEQISAVKNQTTFPTGLTLLRNYPNPFNPTTTVSFDLPKTGHVNLELYDLQGRRIETLVNQLLTRGNHQVEWHAANLPSGVYIARLSTERETRHLKMMLMR